MKLNPNLVRGLFIVAALLCLSPWISAGVALLMGVVLAVSFGNPYSELTKSLTHRLLSLSVIGLGAGMNLNVVAQVGLHGIGYTVIGIGTTFLLGTLFGKLLKISPDTSILVTSGTAICGGSAIAAISPVLKAKSHEVSVALGIVFMLNACALFIFPAIGHHFQMSEGQFGLWSALAIHDTSSVVGATMHYGPHALEVGTTVKLARALWIVPITFIMGWIVSRRPNQEAGETKKKYPWFILGFLAMAAIMTWIPSLQGVGHVIETISKRVLVLTLFLIGTNLTKETLQAVGFRPFVQGICLWIIMASASLFAILEGWIG